MRQIEQQACIHVEAHAHAIARDRGLVANGGKARHALGQKGLLGLKGVNDLRRRAQMDFAAFRIHDD